MFAPGAVVELAPDDARRVTVVLRGSQGDPLEVVDSSGRAYAATLVLDGNRALAALVAERSAPPATLLQIALAQGIPKAAKMDFVVEKATELGVRGILPFASRRTVGDLGREGKVERWRRLAKSAAEQSGRSDITAIEEPLTFAALVARVASYDLTLVAWELAPAVPLRERLPSLLKGVRSVLVVIGPEGGLAEDEAAAALAAGAHAVSLGSRIFRTETAGLVLCSTLLYESGDL